MMALATTGLSCGQADFECCSSYRAGDHQGTVLALEEGWGPLSWLLWPLGYADAAYSAVMDDFRGRLRPTRRLWWLLG